MEISEARPEERKDEDRAPAFPSVAIAAIAGVGLVGALAWGLVAFYANLEVGYLAWGIGALAGFVAVKFGGRGAGIGVLAGAVTLLSMFGGKLLSVRLEVWEFIGEGREGITQEDYDEHLRDAQTFAGLAEPVSDQDLRRFLVDHDYYDDFAPEDVPAEDLVLFREESAPELRAFAASPDSFEEWREQVAENLDWILEEVDYLEAVREGLGIVDVLFVLLGVGTAFRLCNAAASSTRRRPGSGA